MSLGVALDFLILNLSSEPVISNDVVASLGVFSIVVIGVSLFLCSFSHDMARSNLPIL